MLAQKKYHCVTVFKSCKVFGFGVDAINLIKICARVASQEKSRTGFNVFVSLFDIA